MSDAKKVAVVVGAGPGLGAAAARRFAASGMTAVLVSRSADRLKDLADNIDGAVAYPCDATDELAVEKLFADMESKHGPVEVLVLSARRSSRTGNSEPVPKLCVYVCAQES